MMQWPCRTLAAALNISREQRQHQPRVSALPGSVSGRKIRSLLWRRIGALTALILAYRRDVILYPWLEEAVFCIGQASEMRTPTPRGGAWAIRRGLKST